MSADSKIDAALSVGVDFTDDSFDTDAARRKLRELNLREIEARVSMLEDELESHKQDRGQRGDFSGKIYGLVLSFLFGVFFLLLLSGFNRGFHLSDTVLVTLLGTTTATVLGVFRFVVKYLFHDNP